MIYRWNSTTHTNYDVDRMKLAMHISHHTLLNDMIFLIPSRASIKINFFFNLPLKNKKTVVIQSFIVE